MVYSCSVFGFTNRGSTNSEGQKISFHRFPCSNRKPRRNNSRVIIKKMTSLDSVSGKERVGAF